MQKVSSPENQGSRTLGSPSADPQLLWKAGTTSQTEREKLKATTGQSIPRDPIKSIKQTTTKKNTKN